MNDSSDHHSFLKKFVKFLTRCLMMHSGATEKVDVIRKFHITGMIVCSVLVSSGHALLYPKLHTMHELEEHINYLNYTVYFTILTILWMLNRRPLGRLIKLASRNVYTYSNGPQQRIHEEQTCGKENATAGNMMKGASLVYGPYLTTFIVTLLRTVSLDSTERLDDCHYYHVFPSWYPFDVTDKYTCSLTVLIQLTYFLPLALCSSANLLISIYFFNVFEVQRRSLRTVISQIDEIVAERIKLPCDKKGASNDQRLPSADGEEFVSCILECARHHREITKLVSDFKLCYRWILVLYTIFCGSIFSMNCYYLVTIGATRYWNKTIQRISGFIACISYFYFFCHIGSNFQDLGKEFRSNVYNIRWYNYDVKCQKTVLLILTIANWRDGITFGLHSAVSYELFLSVVKASYSYLNLLLKSKK